MLRNQESFSCDRLINLRIFLHVFLHRLHDVRSLLFGLLRKVIPKENVDTRDSRRTSESSTTGSRRVDERIRMHHRLPDLLGRDEGRYGHDTATKCLSHCHDIRNHSPVINPPEFPRTTESSLDFIGDEEDSMFLSGFSNTWPEVIRWNNRTSLSLNRFHHDRGYPHTDRITDLELTFHSFCITEWNMIDGSPIELSDRFTIVFLPNHRECAHRLPMESFHSNNKTRFFRIHLRELDSSFIRFCPTACEETIFQISWCDLSYDTSENTS